MIGLIGVQVFGSQDTAQGTECAHGVIAATRMPDIGGFHVATVVHSLVVGGVLFLIVGICHPTDGGITSIDTQVDGDAAGLVVEIDLYNTTFVTRRITQTYLVGARRHGRQLECDVEDTTDTDGIGLIRPPIFYIAVHSDKGLFRGLPVGDISILESCQDVFPIAPTAIAVHEIRAEYGGIDTDATVEHDIAYLGGIGEDIVEIMVDTVQRILVGSS